MPELPEVESLRRQLSEVIVNEKIIDMKILDRRLGVINGVIGRRVEAVNREGKALTILFDNGRSLLLHLRMTGRMLWQSCSPALLPHTRFVIRFSSGHLLLIDPRRFATLAMTEGERPLAFVRDPLRALRVKELVEIAKRRMLPVKSFLMDQRLIAGIGNIYACEILHAVSIKPSRPSREVAFSEWRRIEKAAKKILERAIACRGTTVSDWRDLFGEKGSYQDELRVYGREGLQCLRCRGTIARIAIGGRGTFFCPSCQQR
ncbi:MAG TPA: bifunctional DNA-formamidopyrimidine glycosylase/DNA-(apurinic or apyrimidinic site) lyase [Syntrophales bacterium]|nr:bifunctional DNA-formamidopyrimidine glycosylase/DNA-(apurinic or apyrimidinic site) lyase [Syntrophales bacterium]